MHNQFLRKRIATLILDAGNAIHLQSFGILKFLHCLLASLGSITQQTVYSCFKGVGRGLVACDWSSETGRNIFGDRANEG